MAQMTERMTDMARAGQTFSMQALLAEMKALTVIMGGVGAADPDRTEAQRLAHEAEVEAGFDNMPV